MRRFLTSIMALALMFGFSAPAWAQIEKYNLDTTHTQILFFVNHLGFSNSQGKFLEYDGHFMFNRGEPAKSSVEITIQSASIDMDDEKWDTHMKSKDFFNVEKFPTMTFKGTAIEITGENTANITGDMTILGVTKPVVLATVHNKSGKHAFSGKYVAGLSATATLKRSDFGMDYGLPLIGDEVQLRLEIEGIREDLGSEGLTNN